MDDKIAPQAALVWAIGRWAYIDGDPLKPGLKESFSQLVRDTIIPFRRQFDWRWFEFYTADTLGWSSALETSLRDYKLEKHYETVFTFDKQRYLDQRRPPALPAQAKIEKVDLPILPPALRDAVSISEGFKAKTSFGFQLAINGRATSICRSNGFISDNEFMIDIETIDPGERRKGYATAVATALIDFCLEQRYVPLWEATLENIPSQRVAHRLGFVESESYPVFAILF